MAYYAYKRFLGVLPEGWLDHYAKIYEEENGETFDCTADYDGGLWWAAAEYIVELQEEIKRLKGEAVRSESLTEAADIARSHATCEGVAQKIVEEIEQARDGGKT